jgi:diguanylate cyclase (GGDEF)-like protein
MQSVLQDSRQSTMLDKRPQAESLSAQLICALLQDLQTVQEPNDIAALALKRLCEALKVGAGAVLIHQGPSLTPLAITGNLPEFLLTPDFADSQIARDAYQNAIPTFYSPGSPSWDIAPTNQPAQDLSFVFYPVGHTIPVRIAVFLAGHPTRTWLEAEKTLLASACSILEMFLKSALLKEQHTLLSSLQTDNFNTSANDRLNHIVATAVAAVPAASSGTLMVHRENKFYFRAAAGYDMSILKEASFRAADMVEWYDLPYQTHASVEPKIINWSAIQQQSFRSVLFRYAFQGLEGCNVTATLSLPIFHHGKLLAVLNLDSFCAQSGFASDSLELIRMFTAPVALVLREQHYDYLLEKTALIDPLTNLGNQRGFDQALQREFSRAQRYQHPFSILIIDLNNLTPIANTPNDALLLEVAHALSAIVRKSDSVFALPDYKFAALLPNTAYPGAIITARRCARGIKRIPHPTTIKPTFGVTTYPTCAQSLPDLLGLGYQRLQDGKAQDISIFLAEGCFPAGV